MAKKDTKFKPGQSGNPKGRPPKDRCFSETARELMSADSIVVTWSVNDKTKVLNLSSDKSIYYGLASALIMEGFKGNTVAIRELLDRTEGKPQQHIDHTTGGEKVEGFKLEFVDPEKEESE